MVPGRTGSNRGTSSQPPKRRIDGISCVCLGHTVYKRVRPRRTSVGTLQDGGGTMCRPTCRHEESPWTEVKPQERETPDAEEREEVSISRGGQGRRVVDE